MQEVGRVFLHYPRVTKLSEQLILHKHSPIISFKPLKINPIHLLHPPLSLSHPKPMAQKREKEETELKVPETLTLCSPPIAVASSTVSASASDDRRSSPERSDLNSGVVAGVIGNIRSNSGPSPEQPDLPRKRRSEAVEKSMSTGSKSSVIGFSPEKPDLHRKRRSEAVEFDESLSNSSKRREVNRCSGCKKKVGLMGFRCRCGDIFCSEHRYSDRHDCSYDYKAAGREAIARENPVVRAAKILKV